MLRSFRHGSALCLLLVTPVAWASPASPVAGPAAFDAAFATALREGMGTTPAEGAAAVAALRATLPANDPLRERRFVAMACSAAQNDRTAALAWAGTLLAAEEARPSPDPTSLALLHTCRAAFLAPTTDAAIIKVAYDAAVEAAQRSAAPILLGQVLSWRSGAHSVAGDFTESLIDALAAQRVLEESGEPFLIAANLQNVGIAYRRMGEYARAGEYLERSLDDPEIQSRWWYRLISLLQLGYLYEETLRSDDARAVLGKAIDVCTANDSPTYCGYARLALASVEAKDGDPEKALALVERSMADFQAAGEPGDIAMANFIRGQALARQSRDADALAMLDEAVAAWTKEDNARYLALALPVRAAVLERIRRYEAVIADLRAFIAVKDRDNDRRADQRTDLIREQFEAERREIENAQLRARERLREQEIQALDQVRRWQRMALGLGLLLAALLAILVLRQIARAKRLQAMAMTDPLTGLANRRRMEFQGRIAVREARTAGTPLALFAIDIDHFKAVNDAYGHATGDAVLARIAQECQRTLRQHDLIGRIGGEEFAGLLPGTSLETAVQVAERIRGGVAALDLDDLVPGLRVTISLGVAALDRHDGDFATLLDRADKALYRAKESGRDRVEVAAAP
jgi:diguanylate cyclase (GGDEF)-like protein